jgi:hypothetical protein
MMGKRNRYHNESNLLITDEGLSMAERLLNDPDYEKKATEVMEILQGKRIAGKQQLGSIINGGD